MLAELPQIPEIEQLVHIFNNATVPAFFLGAVAAFVSLMTGRLAAVHKRIEDLETEAPEVTARRSRPVDIGDLRHRARLLGDGIVLALGSGIASTVLLALMFAGQLAGFRQLYGVPALFVVATLLLGAALLRYLQEAAALRADHQP
jgi:hypothetical protein